MANFRLICATHKNLRQLVDEGKFREDLYYRINVFPIYLPSLSERKTDIPLIAESLLNKINKDMQLTEKAKEWLTQFHYRGNIRELRNILERACILSNNEIINHHLLTLSVEADQKMLEHSSQISNLKINEQQLIKQLLIKHDNNKQAVADELNISLRTLYRKLEIN